jgi:predicted nucleic-acid-binding Zn-ribbon protein
MNTMVAINKLNWEARKMICPKCHSENVTVQIVETGAKTSKLGNAGKAMLHNTGRAAAGVMTLGASNLFISKEKGHTHTKISSQKMCVCQKCGNSWAIK